MRASEINREPDPLPPEAFHTTHWSVVLAATDRSSVDGREALESLCRAYWHPLYAFVVRRGWPFPDAQDLTQSFFTRLIEKDYLLQAQQEKGRFRSFLLTSLKHFLANEWNRDGAIKRGGGCTFVPWDEPGVEALLERTPSETELSPEATYERQWALTLLDRVFASLREECAAAGKEALFDALRPCLSGERSTAPYSELAATLQMTPGAVQVAVHRLRRRYGELLRAEIADTVEWEADVDDELRHLFAALRS